jgi:hypothetical protein
MRHRHYAPKAQVLIAPLHRQDLLEKEYDALLEKGFRPVILGQAAVGRACFPVGKDAREETYELFCALRQLDRQGYTHILCLQQEATDIGLALMNRLLRAAEFTFIKE